MGIWLSSNDFHLPQASGQVGFWSPVLHKDVPQLFVHKLAGQQRHYILHMKAILVLILCVGV